MSTDYRYRSPEDRDPLPLPSRPQGIPGKATVSSRLPAQPLILRQRDGNGVAADAAPAVERAASSSGHGLPEDLRARFEASLGADLSAVRVHTGAESAQAARAVGAKAYTTGQDIHFSEASYDPSSAFGVHLIAHEVAHTVQQQGSAPTRQHKLEVSGPADSAEIEADRAADAMVSGERFAVTTTSANVARQEAPESQDPYAGMNREGEEMTRSRPDPVNWDVGPNGVVDGAWSGRPEILNAAYEEGDDDYVGYMADPGMMEGAAEITSVWDHVQATWTTVWAMVSPYRQIDKEAETAAALLTDDTSHRESSDQTLAHKTKPEGSDVSIGGAFNPDGSAAGGDHLTPAGLEGKDRDAALDAKKQVEKLDVKISTQHLAVKNAAAPGVAAVNNALNALDHHGMAQGDADKEEFQKDLDEWEDVKASYASDIKNAKSVVALINGALDKKLDFDALADLYETTLNDGYFKPKLDSVKDSMSKIQGKATRAKVQIALRNAESAAALVAPALDQVEVARNGLRELMIERDRLMIEVSNAAKDLAVQAGASEAEGARVQAAVRAIPILERVVGESKAIAAAVSLPAYTHGSGFGAALTVNIAELIAHVGALKGTKVDMQERAEYWKQRLDSAQKLVNGIK